MFTIVGCNEEVDDGYSRQVWIFAGQSNCVGAASVSSLPAADQTPDARVKYWYTLNDPVSDTSGGWTDLKGSSNNVFHGSERTFGRDMADAGKNIAIIKYAVNGTPLATRWLPSLNDLYPKLLSEISSALDSIVDGYQIRGAVWIGCEGDAQGVNALNIADNLATFFNQLRADLGVTFRAYVARLNENMDRPYLAEAQQQQDGFRDNDINARVISTAGLTLFDQGDPGPTGDIHYDSASQQALGSRIASAALG